MLLVNFSNSVVWHTVAQVICSSNVTFSVTTLKLTGPGSIPAQSVSDLWWKSDSGERFISKNFGFALSVGLCVPLIRVVLRWTLNISEMIVTEEKQSTRRKICPSATFSIKISHGLAGDQIRTSASEDSKNWKYFSLHCSPISERAVFFGRFPCFARLSFW